VSLNNNTTDATIGAATVYLSGALDHKYLLTFKCIKKEAPSYLSNKLSYVSETNPYAVRNAINGNLNAPKPKTELFKKTYRRRTDNAMAKRKNMIIHYIITIQIKFIKILTQ
jgi:hypothetical protein